MTFATLAGIDATDRWTDPETQLVHDVDGVNQWPSLADAKTTSSRTEVLLNLNSWTLCCVKDAGLSETCAGFLSECDSVYLARLTKANGTRAALRSGPWKIILNEVRLKS